MVCQGIIRGRTIELDPYPEGEAVTISIERAEPPRRGSAAAILRAVHALPHLDPEDVDELERAIESGRLPVRDQDLFGSE